MIQLQAIASFAVTLSIDTMLRDKRETECKRVLRGKYRILCEEYGDGGMTQRAMLMNIANPKEWAAREYERQAASLLAALRACE